MENIYQQAIADAKALRASAMANAKAALQEAFEPKIEEMVRLKLSEELDEVEELEETEELEEVEETENEGAGSSDYMEETKELEESDLEEILAELEALSEDGGEEEEEVEELEEANMSYQYDEGNFDEAKKPEGEEEEEEEDGAVADDEAVAGDEGETKEITVSLGDLKDLIDKIKSMDPELAGDEMTDDEAVTDDTEEVSDEESISLDEILAELEEESLEEKKDKEKIGGHKGAAEKEAEKHTAYKKKVEEKKDKAYEAELEEAKATIAQLQESLNEINLLNAKLLYMNKIFKAKSLTESQKINVVKAFDKATSVKEVKNTFEILKESATTQKKSQINESFGYASKPAGVSPNANVIDADPFVSRWQKLAGL